MFSRCFMQYIVHHSITLSPTLLGPRQSTDAAFIQFSCIRIQSQFSKGIHPLVQILKPKINPRIISETLLNLYIIHTKYVIFLFVCLFDLSSFLFSLFLSFLFILLVNRWQLEAGASLPPMVSFSNVTQYAYSKTTRKV